MSSDSWDDRRKALEESYFDKQNSEALARLKERSGNKVRLSPITGKPMQQVSFMGVAIDRCPDSGGVWLDAGELELIIENSKKSAHPNWVNGFLNLLSSKKI